MKYLLDTHILIWYFKGDEKLSEKARSIIKDNSNEIYFSSISIFEVDLKCTTKDSKMPYDGEELVKYCFNFGFNELPLKLEHALEVKNLKRKEGKLPHKDPFDNLMLAQAVAEGMQFMTHDNRIAEYDCPNVYKI